MTWHYQILKHPDGWYGLHEVYEGLNDDGSPGWTSEPIGFVAIEEEGPECVIKALEMALRDAKKYPVLVVKDGENDAHEP